MNKYFLFFLFIGIFFSGVCRVNSVLVFKNLVIEGSNNVYGSNAAGCTYTISYYAYDVDHIVLYSETSQPPSGGYYTNSDYGVQANIIFRVPVGNTIDIGIAIRTNTSIEGLLYTSPPGLYSYPACEVQPSPLINTGANEFYFATETSVSTIVLNFQVSKFITVTVESGSFYTCTGFSSTMTKYTISCLCSPNPLSSFPSTVDISLIDGDSQSTYFFFPSFINTGPIIGEYSKKIYPNNPAATYQWPMNFYQSIQLNNTIKRSSYYISTIGSVQDSIVPPFGSSISASNGFLFAYGNPNEKTVFDRFLVTKDGYQSFRLMTFNNLTVDEILTTPDMTISGGAIVPISYTSSSISFQGNLCYYPFETLYLPILNNYLFKFSVGQLTISYYYQYPFGIRNYNPTTSVPPRYSLQMGYRSQYLIDMKLTDAFSVISAQTSSPGLIVDNIAPQIVYLEYLKADSGLSRIIRVGARDTLSGVYKITYSYSYTEEVLISITSADLVLGSFAEGIYEKYITAPSSYTLTGLIVTIYDYAGNFKRYLPSNDHLQNFPFDTEKANNLVGNSNITVTRFGFQYNNVNLTSNGVNNTLKFNFDGLPGISSYVSLGLSFDVLVFKRFYGLYDPIEGCYVIHFYLPPRLLTGPIDYFIDGDTFRLRNIDILDIENSTLTVVSNWADNFPPMVKAVNSQSSVQGSINTVIFDITIEDKWNGFRNGLLSLESNVDHFPRNFSFTSEGKNMYLDTYRFNFTIDSSECLSQTFRISYLSLTDNSDITSNTLDTRYNPFLMNYDSLKSTVSLVCSANTPSTTPPILSSMSYSHSLPINVADPNAAVSFLLTVYDPFLRISTRHTPYCYISTFMLDMITIQSEFVGFVETSNQTAQFLCSSKIPYGFGILEASNLSLQIPLRLSIHGYANIFAAVGGMDSTDLQSASLISDIPIQFDVFPFVNDMKISKNITNGIMKLDIIGHNLISYSIINISITYLNTNFTEYLTTEITSNLYMRTSQISDFYGKANVSLDYGTYKTPGFVVQGPIFTPTTTPIIKPTCKGDPVCGGPSNGECTSNGCICKDPWLGISCQSQNVIIIPPVINTTSPTIDHDFNVTLPDGEKLSLKNLISIVQLNEFNYKGELFSRYKFNQWLFTNNTPLTNQSNYQEYLYQTSISEKNSNVTISIQIFSKGETIEFAGQQLKMLPSTIKYKVFIDQYSFNSRLNYLELVMSASFENLGDTDGLCSSSEFGQLNENQSNSDYLKLEVGEHSLYGRFVRRGIIDGSIITNITNRIVKASELGLTASEKGNYISQEFISMIIPYFHSNSTLDPDFSVLIDTTPLTNENPNSICLEKSSTSSKLTKSQLAGIIIGSVGFFIVVVISITYYIYKKKQYKKFSKDISNKLKNMN